MGLRLSGDFLNYMTKIQPTGRTIVLDILKSMLNEIKKNSPLPTLSNKSISIIGIIVIAVYLTRIRHYPVNISLENGVTILVVSYLFGALYIFLFCFLMSIGWAVAYAISNIAPQRTTVHDIAVELLKTDATEQTGKIARIIISIISLMILTYVLGFCSAILTAAIFSALYFIAASVFKTGRHKASQYSRSIYEEIPKPILHLISTLLFAVPIYAPNMSNPSRIGDLINEVMEIASIRIKNKDIYIKAPYGELFSANSRNTTPVGNNFIILKNATILLNDIGGETLISYGDAKTAKRLSIPSAYVSIGEIYDLNKEPSPPREPSAVGSQK